MEELILKERETREKIVQTINESGLPAIMLRSIFKDVLEQLNILEQQQYVTACQSRQEADEKEESEAKQDD